MSRATQNRVILLILINLLFEVQACQSTQPASKLQAEYIADEILVTFREGTPEFRANAINESLQMTVVRKLLSGRIYLIKVPTDKSLEEVLQKYSSFPEVEAVGLNFKIRPQSGSQ